MEIVPPPPRQKISDPEELADYRLRKRKQFEDNIRLVLIESETSGWSLVNSFSIYLFLSFVVHGLSVHVLCKL